MRRASSTALRATMTSARRWCGRRARPSRRSGTKRLPTRGSGRGARTTTSRAAVPSSRAATGDSFCSVPGICASSGRTAPPSSWRRTSGSIVTVRACSWTRWAQMRSHGSSRRMAGGPPRGPLTGWVRSSRRIRTTCWTPRAATFRRGLWMRRGSRCRWCPRPSRGTVLERCTSLIMARCRHPALTLRRTLQASRMRERRTTR
mmetsp:Transcript_6946/g.20948  ORF Transcript_6946/g.20948 Transcript_6946/m.20948 type:complete len:203 (+) Transcript_6946:262-870(+)